MPTWVYVHHRVVAAVCIQIETVYGIWCEVFNGVGIEESACFGIIEAGLEIIKLGVGIVVIRAISERVDVTNEVRLGVLGAIGI